jgi:hypothetical protein
MRGRFLRNEREKYENESASGGGIAGVVYLCYVGCVWRDITWRSDV